MVVKRHRLGNRALFWLQPIGSVQVDNVCKAKLFHILCSIFAFYINSIYSGQSESKREEERNKDAARKRICRQQQNNNSQGLIVILLKLIDIFLLSQSILMGDIIIDVDWNYALPLKRIVEKGDW